MLSSHLPLDTPNIVFPSFFRIKVFVHFRSHELTHFEFPYLVKSALQFMQLISTRALASYTLDK